METLIDTFTKSPSQTLVKSAGEFGKDSMKILSDCLDESVKTVTFEVTEKVDALGKNLNKAITTNVDKFNEVFRETGKECFSEWGLSIERGAGHIGEKLQNGVSNGFSDLGTSFENAVTSFGKGIVNVLDVEFSKLNKNISEVGIPQMKHFKTNFKNEISIVSISLLLISVGVFLFGLGYVSTMPIFDIFKFIFFKQFKTTVFLGFGCLLGYAIFVYNKSLSEPDIKLSEKTVPKTMKKRLKKKRKIENNKVVMISVILSIGFVTGNLSTHLFFFSPLNFIVCLLMLLAVSQMVYKTLVYEIILKIYSVYRNILEYKEWRKNKYVLMDQYFEKEMLAAQNSVRIREQELLSSKISSENLQEDEKGVTAPEIQVEIENSDGEYTDSDTEGEYSDIESEGEELLKKRNIEEEVSTEEITKKLGNL